MLLLHHPQLLQHNANSTQATPQHHLLGTRHTNQSCCHTNTKLSITAATILQPSLDVLFLGAQGEGVLQQRSQLHQTKATKTKPSTTAAAAA
jgi:hypothetical protein